MTKMRRSYTKIKKRRKRVKKAEVKANLSIPSTKKYFKDKDDIRMSISALVDLQNSYGWKIIQAYLNESRKQMLHDLLILDNPDIVEKNRQFVRLQDRIAFIDYVLTLPQFTIEGYQEETGTKLDPYK